jgi:hypothetical protein
MAAWQLINGQSRSLRDLAGTFQEALPLLIFVDSHSDYSHVFLQEDFTMDKLDYEHQASTFGVAVKGYLADNGHFADAAWWDSCIALQQSFQFCGIGSHHQKCIAERRIRDLLDAAGASLLHAIQHWSDGVSKNLWPFALKCALI